MTSLRPLRLRTARTVELHLFPSTYGSPDIGSQWSNEHCGKAFPPVFERSAAVKPNDSITGKYANKVICGVPGFCSSEKTCPRRCVRTPYTLPIASCGTEILHKYTGSRRPGSAVIKDEKHTRRDVGMICPIPRWMASA